MAEKVVIGNAELWHGDCLDVLPLLTADAVATDPPYGYSYESNYTAETTTAARQELPRCSYCQQPDIGWTARDLLRGKRDGTGYVEYHCYAAKCLD